MGAWALGLCLCALTRQAAALEYSELEQRMLLRALGQKPPVDAAPEGKRIESIRIVRLPVFDDDDPIPDFVNWFHAQSREHVIRRELVFEQGEVYRAQDIEETIRNLQLIPQFGVVVIVPLRGRRADQVEVVVIVRDVWSLRLNFQLAGTPTTIGSLLVNPIEENLFGLRTRLGAVFELVPDRYSVGGLLAQPRLFGTKVDAFAYAGAHVNSQSGETEGSFGTFSLYQNFVELDDEWAFLVGTAWAVEQTRVLDRLRSGVLIDYGWPPSAEVKRELQTSHGIPIEYRQSVFRGGGEVARAFGQSHKTILTLGVEGNRRKFVATRRPQDSQQDFAAFVREELPVSDTRISPFVQLEHKTTRYLATRDVETLELQESFSLGQQAALRVYPAARDLGSSRDLVGTVAWLGYTWPLDDGFVRGVASSHIEQADHGKNQAAAQAAFRYVSPRLRFARVVVDAALVNTYENYLNRKLVMGGESRPRGYVPFTFRGPSGFASSLELRSFAINILSARVGAVAFYDVGGVGESVPDLRLKQSLGAGVRVLFPQINRACFRLDWAAPLTAGFGREPDRALPGGIYFTFGQAFDLPKLKLPEILGAETTLLELAQ